MRKLRNKKKIVFCAILILTLGFSFFAFADEKRGKKVDREMGGMEEGSRISAPKKRPEGQTEGGHPLTTPQAPVNQAAEKTPGGSTARDAIGEVEEKKIFKFDLEGEGVARTELERTTTGTPAETTTETTTGTTTEAPLETKIETGTTTETTTGGGTTTETSSNPIVGADVNADLQSGQVETEVTVDTSGELEEKQILDTDLNAEGAGSAEAEVGSATDITESTVVEETNVTTEPVETVPVETVLSQPLDVTADVDTTGETLGSEADVGVSADVSQTSESEEEADCDPANNLSLTTCTSPLP